VSNHPARIMNILLTYTPSPQTASQSVHTFSHSTSV